MSSSSGYSGTFTSVPSACGTRAHSPCPPSIGPSAPLKLKKAPLTQDDVMPLQQFTQVPSLTANGAITKSPGRSVVTSAPTSSMTPTSSCPIRLGSGSRLIPR
ncbi:unannotated protein [freshwater metagenome]|uniref:Unannotated protein n=1 Tax=freshwater metagenome TaxID=449393 RepID=A0A6J7DBU0_9ZZZZ